MQNVDGTTITDLTSLRAYWRCGPGNGYPLSDTWPAPTTGTVTLHDVETGCDGVTVYFVMTAIAAGSSESAFSNEATKVMPPGSLPGKAGLAVTTQPDAPVSTRVTLTNFDDTSPSPELTLTISGSGPVTIALLPASSFWDQCPLGVNDGQGPNAMTFTAPFSARCDVDGTQPFQGGTVTAGGVSKPLVRVGATWEAVLP